MWLSHQIPKRSVLLVSTSDRCLWIPTYGVYIKLIASWVQHLEQLPGEIEFTHILSAEVSGAWNSWGLMSNGHSLAPGLGLERSHTPCTTRVLRLEAWGSRQDHWAAAKAWEALTTESRGRGQRGPAQVTCSSRGGRHPAPQGSEAADWEPKWNH